MLINKRHQDTHNLNQIQGIFMIKIGIIGGGISGLTLASKLKKYANITVFEKSRGLGGRMSTRRAEPFYFDHGAQFFKATNRDFLEFIEPMINSGVIKRWDPRIVYFDYSKRTSSHLADQKEILFIGVPGMNSIAKYLANDIEVRLNTRIIAAKRNNNFWTLCDQDGNSIEGFDWVISTAPSKQTLEILPPYFKYYADIKSISMLGCFALMLGYHQNLLLNFDAAFVNNSDISSILVNNSKFGRDNYCSLVIHSTNTWAESHMEDNTNDILDYLCKEASSIVGQDLSNCSYKNLHKWRYAHAIKQNNPLLMADTNQSIAVCGDWCIEGNVEAACLSGMKVADIILKSIM